MNWYLYLYCMLSTIFRLLFRYLNIKLKCFFTKAFSLPTSVEPDHPDSTVKSNSSR